MKVSRELSDALGMWAAYCRGAFSLGYPKEAAFAHEYQAGYRNEARIPSVAEIETLESIHSAIGFLRERYEQDRADCRYVALQEYYGAYPSPPPYRERRAAAYERCGNKNRYYRSLDAAHNYMSGIVGA